MDSKGVLLSIDIGLYNLALCCLQAQGGKCGSGGAKILSWSLLDVLTAEGEKDKGLVCISHLKGKQSERKCENPAKFVSFGKGVYCAVHSRAVEDAVELTGGVSGVTCSIKKCKRVCAFVDHHGTAFCKSHGEGVEGACAIKKSGCGAGGRVKVKDLPLQDTLWKLVSALDAWCKENASVLARVGRVVIEKQPLENKKMQVASHVIYTHFLKYFQNKVEIRLLPAYHKLSVYTGPHVTCALKTEYAKRKYLSIEYTRWYLSEFLANGAEWKEYFEAASKKDDLGDSLLQGLFILLGKKEKVFEGGKRKQRRRKKLRF